jgi:hypothetical protein
MHKRAPLYPRIPRSAIGFRPEFLDFRRGIRVGNLEENERITRLLKLELEFRFRQPFVTERWGRGVHWIWIGYLSRANRAAKPISNSVSFGCAKFFVMIDSEESLFKCGLQVERGYIRAPGEYRDCELKDDWDWHRLLKALKPGSAAQSEIERLVKREGFRLHAGGWDTDPCNYSRRTLPPVAAIRRALAMAPPSDWAGFQLYYPMTENEVKAATGIDLLESMLAIFDEVTPMMNLCMQVKLPSPTAIGN